MADVIRKTPLEFPRAFSFRKSYTAYVCENGKVLLIDEKLGRRVLRTLHPASREGRELLRGGSVLLTSTRRTGGTGEIRRTPSSDH